jgi:outer membrane lipoprotein LolB
VEQRQSIKNWEIRGRLGVQTETNGGSMDIIWKQSGQEYSIRLIAPLGAGNYHIQGDDTFAEIYFPDGHRETLDNIEGAFSSILDVELPVSAINDWVRGIPARSMTISNPRWDDSGLLTNVQQSGWNVEMKKYTGSSIPLPHAIYLSRDDNTDLDIRLALRQWLVDN